MSKSALGRGLKSLLPPRPTIAPLAESAGEASASPVAELPLDSIVPNPFQPRRVFNEQALQELAQSIASGGVIQPVVVRKAGDSYQLIAGERRWRASRLAGLTSIPVHVQIMPDERMLENALVENIQREDLNAIEAAQAFRRLSQDLGLSHEEIGKRTGKDRTTISNAIRLLQLSAEVQQLIAEGKLSSGHARALLKIEDPDAQRDLARKTIERNWSVRTLEGITTAPSLPQPTDAGPTRPDLQDPNVRAALEQMERVLGTRVRLLERGNGRGRLEIEYYSPEDLDRIYATICGELTK